MSHALRPYNDHQFSTTTQLRPPFNVNLSAIYHRKEQKRDSVHSRRRDRLTSNPSLP